jgi:protein-S-isoprenylcysteine O-methyltransferase Ste14
MLAEIMMNAFIPALLCAFMAGAIASCLLTLWISAASEERDLQRLIKTQERYADAYREYTDRNADRNV